MKKKKKEGRPSKLTKIDLNEVYKLACFGLIESQIASVLNICQATLSNYKKNPKFLEAIKKGKDKADSEVAKSLYKRAIGYEYEEINRVGNRVKKQVMPDVLAQIFWLKNRRPEEWRDKQDIEHSAKEGQPMFIITDAKHAKK